jgi:hypothetical protein
MPPVGEDILLIYNLVTGHSKEKSLAFRLRDWIIRRLHRIWSMFGIFFSINPFQFAPGELLRYNAARGRNHSCAVLSNGFINYSATKIGC